MIRKNRLLIPLLLAMLTLRCPGQAPDTPNRTQDDAAKNATSAEQEKARAAAAANAEKLDKAADALVAEVQSAVAAGAPIKTYDALLLKLSSLNFGNQGTNDRSSRNTKLEILRLFITRWQDYLYASEQGNFESASQTLRQMIQEAAVLPIIPRSELMDLHNQIGAKTTDAGNAIMTPLLAKLDKVFESADAAADFDPILADINAAQTKETQARPNLNSSVTRTLQGLRQFVIRWQEYLTLRDSGKTQDAQNLLRNLSTDSSYATDEIIVRYRAKARERLANPKAVGPAPDSLKVELLTLEKLDAFAAAVKAQEIHGGNTAHPRLADTVRTLLTARDQLRTRAQLSAMRSLQFSHPESFVKDTGVFATALESVRRDLFNQGISLQLPASVAPLADENPRDFLRRIIQTQLEARNYHAVYDALKLSDLLNNQSAQIDSMDSAVFRALIEGGNQESAGQYALAVKAYQRALASPSRLVPIEEVKARLSKIKQEHPEAFGGPLEGEPAPLAPVTATLPKPRKSTGTKPAFAPNKEDPEPPDEWKLYYFGSTRISQHDDQDGDGVTNYNEYAQGTDPTDYFNGETPVMTVLSGTNRATGEFAMKVTRPDGTPYVGAPVNFEVPSDVAQLAGNPDSTITQQGMRRYTDKNGIARVYIRPPATRN